MKTINLHKNIRIFNRVFIGKLLEIAKVYSNKQ